MNTVLITAYAVNPYKGSEDGMGWNFILQAARFQKVVAVTRRNNGPHIVRYLAENPAVAAQAARVEFLYFDLPAWTRWWKKGPLLSLIYFYMWQLGLALWLRARRPAVDVVHNLNFHNDWTPSFLWLLGRPLVWGPIGHHPPIPASHLARYGAVAFCKDRLIGSLKHFFWHLDPFLWLTRRTARRVLCMNSTAGHRLGRPASAFEIMPSVAIDLPAAAGELNAETTLKIGFTAMIAARMVPLKGFDMVILAFAKFYHALPAAARAEARLLLIGSGPEEGRLNELLADNQLTDCVVIRPWLAREELLTLYQQASVFFFPSHEGAGMVVAEAMSYGVPVLCYENDGPGELTPAASTLKVPYRSFAANVEDFAAQLTRLHHSPLLQAAEADLARRHVAQHHTWERRGHQLHRVYQQVLAA
ncbi:glycosyltransferase family 4 protein [Hymenobacter artigasi]|uniref:Glycosyltransferase involved in cell wall biosynthesis n=1 Tax=Hymenobacter artigasi TaxID=2719616 RepID=A0ABX1HHQ0_9BACT|nr:glycosyltransferase [Hymenobacter artigasi]NKI89380.1 glycosyltransferase involved in cell wall biosynthesis [Hymenobacter artigasi]